MCSSDLLVRVKSSKMTSGARTASAQPGLHRIAKAMSELKEAREGKRARPSKAAVLPVRDAPEPEAPDDCI